MTGVTLSSEQVAWATEVAARKKVPCPNFLRMDYRDIPNTKYNKITCLEMAEHVGVKNFSKFLAQVLHWLPCHTLLMCANHAHIHTPVPIACSDTLAIVNVFAVL